MCGALDLLKLTVLLEYIHPPATIYVTVLLEYNWALIYARR